LADGVIQYPPPRLAEEAAGVLELPVIRQR
jgi:hypothetical protein